MKRHDGFSLVGWLQKLFSSGVGFDGREKEQANNDVELT